MRAELAHRLESMTALEVQALVIAVGLWIILGLAAWLATRALRVAGWLR